MVEGGQDRGKTQIVWDPRPETQAILYLDTTEFWKLGYPINKDFVDPDHPKPFMALKKDDHWRLSYLVLLEVLAHMGVDLRITEAVVYETTGQDKGGEQINGIFRENQHFRAASRFFRVIRGGAIPGARIVETSECYWLLGEANRRAHLDSGPSPKDNLGLLLQQYKGVGDDSIMEALGREDFEGWVGVMSSDEDVHRKVGKAYPGVKIMTGGDLLGAALEQKLLACVGVKPNIDVDDHIAYLKKRIRGNTKPLKFPNLDDARALIAQLRQPVRGPATAAEQERRQGGSGRDDNQSPSCP